MLFVGLVWFNELPSSIYFTYFQICHLSVDFHLCAHESMILTINSGLFDTHIPFCTMKH